MWGDLRKPNATGIIDPARLPLELQTLFAEVSRRDRTKPLAGTSRYLAFAQNDRRFVTANSRLQQAWPYHLHLVLRCESRQIDVATLRNDRKYLFYSAGRRDHQQPERRL